MFNEAHIHTTVNKIAHRTPFVIHYIVRGPNGERTDRAKLPDEDAFIVVSASVCVCVTQFRPESLMRILHSLAASKSGARDVHATGLCARTVHLFH